MMASPVNSNGALDSLGIEMTNILHITSGDIAGGNLANTIQTSRKIANPPPNDLKIRELISLDLLDLEEQTYPH